MTVRIAADQIRRRCSFGAALGSLAAFAALSVLLPLGAAAAGSGVVTIGPQAMEGDLHVNPGDNLKAGFDFTIPGGHPAETVKVVNASVTFLLTCANGSDVRLSVGLPDSTFQVPASSSSWYPSGDQSSPLTYQGATGPVDRCNGTQMRDQQGAVFTATFQSSDTVDAIHVRFHYVDYMQNNSSSWSATDSVSPAAIANTPASGCSNGQVMNSSGQCVTPSTGCSNGQVMNSSGQCVSPASGCSSGQVTSSGGQCLNPVSGTQPTAGRVQGTSTPTPSVGAGVSAGPPFLLIALGGAALIARRLLNKDST
jgi:hypothetical protein